MVVIMDEQFSNTYQVIEHVPIRKFLMILRIRIIYAFLKRDVDTNINEKSIDLLFY